MGRPIKVNRHKGGKVDIYFCSSVGSSVIGGLGCFDNILFVNDSSVIKKKISLFDLTMCSQSGRGECLFWVVIV